MNREESLEWIDLALGAIDRHDMMALINESRDEFDGEFFETINSEVDRYKAESNQAKADRLTEIARTIAALRQNRIEM
jgi:hypothetical protein